jgi:Spy/CpxP family protein refolding chaperone
MGSAVVAQLPTKKPTSMTGDEMEGYLSGAELGQARPAEAFGYPVPKKVMELKGRLELSSNQEGQMDDIVKKLRTETRYYGKKIVVEELALDNYFRSGQTDFPALANRVEKIGGLRWKLRLAHLAARSSVRKVLTAEQLEKCRELGAFGSGRSE